MLSSELLRLNNDGTPADEGHLTLQNAFFAPDEITTNGIDSLLLGATAQIANEIDNQVIDDVRNFLFRTSWIGRIRPGLTEHSTRS